MYKDQNKWLRVALISWDCIISIVAIMLAGIWRFGGLTSFFIATDVEKLCVISLLVSLIAFMMSRMYQKFIIRGYFQEFLYDIRFHFWELVFLLIYIFSTKNKIELSRLTLLYFFPISMVLLFSSHCIIKIASRSYACGNRGWKLLILTDADNVSTTCSSVISSNGWKNQSVSLIMMDGQMVEENILNGITQIYLKNDFVKYVTCNPVDEVLININEENCDLSQYNNIISELYNMGVIVSVKLRLPDIDEQLLPEINKLNDFYLASFSIRNYSFLEILIKRIIDIIGSLVGLIFTLIIGIFISPAILIESPGPILFKQNRVGRNGRIFTMYKFRSMYKDADSDKSKLAGKNKMKGLLFKVDNDPRITRVGKFIRKTSIDELPQFFNVLIGDMSLVGTRPPTIDEYEQYLSHFKRRLSFRPGVTGIWQTSGRNNVMDFDKVLAMDLLYIHDWSILLDIKLILKTIVIVIMGKGAE